MRYILLLCVVFILSALHAIAQPPVPAPAQEGDILIVGATAHLGDGTLIANSAIAFSKGKLTLVVDANTVRIDRSKYQRIFDASGKHVYPGFIAANSKLGLIEIEAIRATQDFAETGDINPNARTLVAYNTDSDLQPTVRSNGVLLAQVAPQGGLVSGTSSIVQLDAWNWEDAAVRTDDGIHLEWPTQRSWAGWETGTPERKKNEQYDKQLQSLRAFFDEAKAYANQPAPVVKNPRMEAMRNLWNGVQTLFIHTDPAKSIQEAVLFAQKYGLRVVIVGGADAWRVADFLKVNEIPVLLSQAHSLPEREDEATDQPFRNALLLHEKGILFGLHINGAGWQQRNLAFQAGHAKGYGLPAEAALSAITLNIAKILRIDQQYGSLATGKSATLFISEGDALDMRTCKLIAAFVDGREIDLDNKQRQLSRRFEEKYKRKKN